MNVPTSIEKKIILNYQESCVLKKEYLPIFLQKPSNLN